VEQSTEAITPLDTSSSRVGRTRRARIGLGCVRSKVHRPMGSVAVGMIHEPDEDPLEVPLIQDQQPVERETACE
jgi:hypothetical protein